MAAKLDVGTGLSALRAVAEPTRLRILFLLRASELTVKDLTKVLGQSQPRISRHLKLLHDAGVIERHREGSWVYFRLDDRAACSALTKQIVAALDEDDEMFRRDVARLSGLVKERSSAAQTYFERNAGDWDRLRALHVDEAEVEATLLQAFGDAATALLVDLGTGTGRMLELFHGRYARGIGIDANQAMLAYARSRLEASYGATVQVRQGDLYNLNLESGIADAVVMHQVLHYLSDPSAGLNEAARILAPGGRLIIVDFAPHDLDFLREDFAHERLGFADGQISQWLDDVGLELVDQRKLESGRGASEQLTVSMWVATRQAEVSVGQSADSQQRVLETI